MTRSEIDAALNRAAAETMGWSWLGQGWRHPSGLLGESPPDYCSPDVPHSTLRGLYRLLNTPCILPILLGHIGEMVRSRDAELLMTQVFDAPARFIVAACLAALDKLPSGVTLQDVRESEEVEG